jgi:hypothetical protein
MLSFAAEKSPRHFYHKLNFFMQKSCLLIALVACFCFFGNSAFGQISISTLGSIYTQDFDGLSQSSCPCNTMPSGWALNEGGSNANGTYTPGNGSSNSGNTYNIGTDNAATDRALGGLRSSNLIPSWGAVFTNNTGSTITSLNITYTAETWRVGAANRKDSISFEYKVNETSLSATGYTVVTQLGYANPGQATTDNGSVQHFANKSHTVTGLSIANGESFAIRFGDWDGAGADDLVGIDDFSLTANGSSSNSITIGTVTTSKCADDTVHVNLTSSGTFASGNEYIAEISTSSTFASGVVEIGRKASTANAEVIVSKIPAAQAADNYYVRIRSTNPVANEISASTILQVKALPSFNPTMPEACVGGASTAFTVINATGGYFGGPFGGTSAGTTVSEVSDPNYLLVPSSTHNGERYFLYTAGNGCSDTLFTKVGIIPNQTTTTDDICNGGTALNTKSLSGTGGSGWAIISGGGSLSNIIPGSATYTPLSAGSKTIRYRHAVASCYEEVTFIVNDLPIFTPAAPSLCVNGASGAVTVSASAGGGFTAVSGAAIDVSISGTDPSYSIAPGGVAGTRTFNYVAANGCGKDFVVTVNNLPASPTFTTATSTRNLTSTCNNASDLTYQVTGGSNYTWNFPAGWSVTGSGANRSVTTIGSSGTISVTNTSGGCTSVAATLNVVVNTAPAIGSIVGSSSVCQNTNGHTYSVADIPTATYTWGGATGTNVWTYSGQSTYELTANAGTGNKTFTVTVTDNGCSATATKSVSTTLPSEPVVTISTTDANICAGKSYTFTAIPTNAGVTPSYQWKVNGVNVGTNSNTFTSSFNSGDDVWVLMTADAAACASPSTDTSNILFAKGLAYDSANAWVESFGTTGASGGTALSGYTGYTNGQSLVFSGTGDVRTTSVVSTTEAGAPAASGGSHGFMNSGEVIHVANINTLNAYPNKLGFYLNKGTNAQNGSDLKIEVSVDGINYFQIPSVSVPTGSGTVGNFIWFYREILNALPKASNVRLRFTSTAGINRIDDLRLTKYTTADATIDTSGPAAFCVGNNVTLTANPASGNTLTYLWTGGSSSNSIIVSATGTSSVTITDAFGCASSASKATTVLTNSVYFRDFDGDGYGNEAISAISCTGAPAGYVADKTDCNDNNINVHPGATEVCGDGIDNDCSGGDLVCSGYTWKGGEPGNEKEWGKPGNWVNNTVPNSCGADVFVPATLHQPQITSGTFAVGNIEFVDGTSLTLFNANSVLQVCGNVSTGSSAGTGVGGLGRVVFSSGTTIHKIKGNLSVDILQLDDLKGAEFVSGGTLNVQGVLELKAGTFATTGGTLRFKSSSVSSAAILDDFSTGYLGTVTGTVQAERFYEAATDTRLHNQHYFGSPVNAPAVTQFAPAKGANGVAVTPTANCDETQTAHNGNYGNVFEWEEDLVSNCYLEGWKVRSAGVVQNARGYSVVKVGSGTLTLTGTPNLDSYYEVAGLTNSSSGLTYSKQGNPYNFGWSLISNPYQASIDLNAVDNADFDDNVLVLNTHGMFPGTFQPVSMAGSGLLAPFQGFIARKSTVGGTATFKVNATDRRRAASTFHKYGDHQMNLMVVGNGFADITYLNFDPNSTDQYDAKHDALKAASNSGQPTLFTYILGSWSSINTNPDVITTPTVRVGFKPGANGTFMFQGEGFDEVPNTTVFLEDLRDNVMQNLTAIPDYTFTSDVNDATDRFLLHFRFEAPNSIGNSEENLSAIKMFPNPTSGMLVLETDAKEDMRVEITDMNGKVVIATEMYRNKTIDVSMLASAIYQVRITSSKGSVVKRLVKE